MTATRPRPKQARIAELIELYRHEMPAQDAMDLAWRDAQYEADERDAIQNENE